MFQICALIFRFHSDNILNRRGFNLQFNAYDFTCGSKSYNGSGVLTFPLQRYPYPAADCVYVISQPNGTYVNISFINIDIDCQGRPFDYLEIRDGDLEDSPLMARFCGNGRNIPSSMLTTQNHMRIRWRKEKGKHNYLVNNNFLLRIVSNYWASGLGFTIQYKKYENIVGSQEIVICEGDDFV